MELYKQILASILGKEEVRVTFPDMGLSAKEIVELECYRTLEEIRAILSDAKLTDSTCFLKIEAIVEAYEGIGSTCGGRHDF